MAINPADVTIRYFNRSDIDDLANYFYKSPPGFFEKMGLKIDFFGSEEEFRNRYHLGMDKIEAGNLIPSIITVFFQGIKIGFHTTTDFLENESLVIHGHFFNAEYRSMGIGMISGLKAAERFLVDKNLKRIIAKVPVRNLAPLRAIEKLGVSPVKSEKIFPEYYFCETEVLVFEVDLVTVKELKKTFGME